MWELIIPHQTFKDIIMKRELNVALSSTFEAVGSIGDTIRIGSKIVNVYARQELVSSKANCAKELAVELGITEAKAQKLMEEV